NNPQGRSAHRASGHYHRRRPVSCTRRWRDRPTPPDSAGQPVHESGSAAAGGGTAGSDLHVCPIAISGLADQSLGRGAHSHYAYRRTQLAEPLGSDAEVLSRTMMVRMVNRPMESGETDEQPAPNERPVP